MKITTKNLAARYGVKVRSIHQSRYIKGHFRNWYPVGYIEGEREGSHSYLWQQAEDQSNPPAKHIFKQYRDGTVGVFLDGQFQCEMPSMDKAVATFGEEKS